MILADPKLISAINRRASAKASKFRKSMGKLDKRFWEVIGAIQAALNSEEGIAKLSPSGESEIDRAYSALLGALEAGGF